MNLTDEQANALWIDNKPAQGFRAISARPGTGKTTTLTQYCIDLTENWHSTHESWQGMAAISYTNVAKDELEHKVKNLGKANSLLSAPHFVGTIDSFINQYIFLPFGSAYLNCSKRPKLVGEPFAVWRPTGAQISGRPAEIYSPIYFDCYSLDKNDNPVRTDTVPRQIRQNLLQQAPPVTAANINKIIGLKKYIWQQGLAVQNDANYFAYKILKDSPDLTRYLITRFPVLIVDEAQDMTELQHALLDHLKAAGQKHIVIIGDEYQAIYEWNTAKPQLFVDKVESPHWSAHNFTQTFRCSNQICHTLNKLANDGVMLAPAHQSKNSLYSDAVEVKEYSDVPTEQRADIKQAIDSLASSLSNKLPHDENVDNLLRMVVLTRSREDVDKLQAIFTGAALIVSRPIVWNYKSTREYVKVLFYLKKRDAYRAFRAYENLLFNLSSYDDKTHMRRELTAKWGVNNPNPLVYRITIFGDLRKINATLPSTQEFNISECHLSCPRGLKGLSDAQTAAFQADFQSFTTDPKRIQDRPISSLMTSRDERVSFRHPLYKNVELLFSTIHGVKGETYDGVLFYTKARTTGCGCTPSKVFWRDILTHPLARCEHKRLIYVALSRAAQNLMIVCPTGQTGIWRSLT